LSWDGVARTCIVAVSVFLVWLIAKALLTAPVEVTVQLPVFVSSQPQTVAVPPS
jgi:hypothetical protein